MYDWSKVKLRSVQYILRRKFKKLHTSLIIHLNKIALCATILKIMAPDIMSRNSWISLNTMYDWSKVKLTSVESILRRNLKNYIPV